MLKQIQNDLLDEKVPLSTILRKASVLAHQLYSEDLKSWAKQELNGYQSINELPDYRIVKTSCVGTWTNGYYSVPSHGVPIMAIKDEELRNLLTTFKVASGVRTVEEFSEDKERILILPQDVVGLVNTFVARDNYGFLNIRYGIGVHAFKQILDTVRNRLLDFVLELDANWPTQDTPPSKTEVDKLLSIIIYNNPQGGSMSIFDQRGQHVNYQYNAAGNINLDTVENKDDFVEELEKLRLEIGQAKESGAIDQNTAIEAEYHLLQATREVEQKKAPEKRSLLEHIGKAKSILEDVTAAAGLVAALLKAVEIANKIFS